MQQPAPTAPAGDAKHVVDALIEDRAPRLIHTPLWPVIRAVGYPLLGYRRAVAMADRIADLSGTECLNWAADYLDLKVETEGLDFLPATGPCVIVANHPGGIADGIAVWDAIRERRPDAVFFANRDALKVCPGLDGRVIPVEWRDERRSRLQSREVLRRAVDAFREECCVVMFPAGRMSQWSWKHWRLHERPWQPTAISLARKFKAPVVPLAIRQRMPFLYYALAQIHEELKDMTLFHGLMGKAGARYRLRFGRPYSIGPDDGSDAQLTDMFRRICERSAWG